MIAVLVALCVLAVGFYWGYVVARRDFSQHLERLDCLLETAKILQRIRVRAARSTPPSAQPAPSNRPDPL